MKKQILLSVLIACAIMFVNVSHAQLKKVAIISVYGDKNLSDDPMNTLIYEKILKDSSYNITRIINDFDKVLREKFVQKFPFEVMAKEDVITTDGYKEIADLTRFKSGNYYVVPGEGYVSIAAWGAIAQDDEAIKKAFEILPDDVDGVIIAYLNFNMYQSGGIGPLSRQKVYAVVNMKIFNRDVKRLFKLREKETSDTGIMAVGGIVTQPKEVMPLIDNASENLFVAMDKKLDKSLGKMIKKMQKEAGN